MLIDPATDFGARIAQPLRDEQVIWLPAARPDGLPRPGPRRHSGPWQAECAQRRNPAHNPPAAPGADPGGTGGAIVAGDTVRIDPDVPRADQAPACCGRYPGKGQINAVRRAEGGAEAGASTATDRAGAPVMTVSPAARKAAAATAARARLNSGRRGAAARLRPRRLTTHARSRRTSDCQLTCIDDSLYDARQFCSSVGTGAHSSLVYARGSCGVLSSSDDQQTGPSTENRARPQIPAPRRRVVLTTAAVTPCQESGGTSTT
jgi:hypothetical protein